MARVSARARRPCGTFHHRGVAQAILKGLLGAAWRAPAQANGRVTYRTVKVHQHDECIVGHGQKAFQETPSDGGRTHVADTRRCGRLHRAGAQRAAEAVGRRLATSVTRPLGSGSRRSVRPKAASVRAFKNSVVNWKRAPLPPSNIALGHRPPPHGRRHPEHTRCGKPARIKHPPDPRSCDYSSVRLSGQRFPSCPHAPTNRSDSRSLL